MAAAAEALGMTLPGASSIPAADSAHSRMAVAAGRRIVEMVFEDLKPREILTTEAFENAVVTTMALGGSTNAIIHLIAMAGRAGTRLDLDRFDALSRRTPFLANVQPSGRYLMEDFYYAGGLRGLLARLEGLLHPGCLTANGRTLGENVQGATVFDDDVIATRERPLGPEGGVAVLRGNLAPDGAVAKITGKEGFAFSGAAIAFDSEEDMLAALERGEIEKGHVIVIRYEGPRGGPGMREMLTPTSAIAGAGLAQDVAMITDGRFSGGSHGFLIGHVTPEAQEGGPLALVRDGDRITIDAKKRTLELEVSASELAQRRAAWKAPALRAQRGTLAKYIRNVRPASEGCVTDE
jgi:dihydroxy-acid dehydratase